MPVRFKIKTASGCRSLQDDTYSDEVMILITALSVKIPEQRRGIRGWADRLRGDRVQVNLLRARGVTLRHVIYTSYSGEVKLEKADEAVGMQRGRLLCSDRLEFPPRSGYKRFSSAAFSSRLCTNFALSVLDGGQADVRVALYDPDAACADLLPHLLACCGDVTAVTDCFEPYLCAADRALEELGAAAVITRRREELSGCGLVIAPRPVREPLPLCEKAVVLTAGKPLVSLNGSVLWRYHFKMPDGFADIKPEELSEEYFCSALYTLGSQFELGSIVPLSAQGERGSCDAKALAAILGANNRD